MHYPTNASSNLTGLLVVRPSASGDILIATYDKDGRTLTKGATVAVTAGTNYNASDLGLDGNGILGAVLLATFDFDYDYSGDKTVNPGGETTQNAGEPLKIGTATLGGGLPGGSGGGSAGVGSKTDVAETDPTADASLIAVAKGLLPLGPVEPTVVTLTASGQDIVPSLAGAGRRWYGTIQWQSTSLDDESTLEWSNDGGTTWHKVMMVKGFAVCIAHSDTNSKVQVRFDTSKNASGNIKAVGYFELTGV